MLCFTTRGWNTINERERKWYGSEASLRLCIMILRSDLEWKFSPKVYTVLTSSPLYTIIAPLWVLFDPPPLLKQVKSHLIRRASVVSSPHIDFSFPLFVSPLLEQHFAIILIYTTSDRKSWVKDDATMTTSGKKVEWKLSPVTWQDILVKLSGEEVQ